VFQWAVSDTQEPYGDGEFMIRISCAHAHNGCAGNHPEIQVVATLIEPNKDAKNGGRVEL
jgi:hypothetical protein